MITKRAVRPLWTAQTSATWALVGIASLLFALYASLPGFKHGVIFEILSAAMPKQVWAAAFGLNGILQIFFSFFRSYRPVRVAVAAAGCALWVFLILSITGGVRPLPPITGEIAVTLASFWLFVRSLLDDE